jgi:phage terminase small subunit
MGRPLKPTALKVLNGSAAHHPERANPDEPKVEALTEVPEPPAVYRITGAARQMWDYLAPVTISMAVLTEVDLGDLATICLAWRTYLQRVRARDDAGADRAFHFYQVGLGRFGLNPSERAKLHVPAKPAPSKMAGLLRPRTGT